MAKKGEGEPKFVRRDLDGSRSVERIPDFGEDTPVEPPKKHSKRSVEAAVALKISGAPYTEIARVLDYTSAAAARQAVEQGLADAYEAKDTASLRRITSARLEGLWQLAWKKSQATRPKTDEFGDPIPGEVENNPEQAAFMRLSIDLTSRYAKLHGLDAPTQVQVSPGAIEFEETVQILVASAKRGLPAEADIFAEVVEDAVELGPDEVLDV